jgi:hypothetical protein
VRRRLTILALLGVMTPGRLGGWAPLAPGDRRWAEADERDRCIRTGDWWRPGDDLDGSGACEIVDRRWR